MTSYYITTLFPPMSCYITAFVKSNNGNFIYAMVDSRLIAVHQSVSWSTVFSTF